MAHFLFNVATGGRAAAEARLQAKMWEVGDDEPHRDALAAGDRVLIYVEGRDGGFVGRAALATAAHPWNASEAAAYPGDARSGVALSDVERWDRPVPMATVVARVDPTASNPHVQANARVGFPSGVVRITADEYAAAVAASHEHQRLA
jgi:hypothetical protein